MRHQLTRTLQPGYEPFLCAPAATRMSIGPSASSSATSGRLAQLLPGFFGRLAVKQSAREHVRPRSRSNSFAYAYVLPNEQTMAKLRVENENDVLLYAHALNVLECRLGSCGIHPPARRVSALHGSTRSRSRELQGLGLAAALSLTSPAVGRHIWGGGNGGSASVPEMAAAVGAGWALGLSGLRAAVNAAGVHMLRRQHRRHMAGEQRVVFTQRLNE